jgi:hypothetical protein
MVRRLIDFKEHYSATTNVKRLDHERGRTRKCVPGVVDLRQPLSVFPAAGGRGAFLLSVE